MISYSASSQLAAYIILSILVLVIICCLLNIVYCLLICLFTRQEEPVETSILPI